MDGMELKFTPSIDRHMFGTVWVPGLILATCAAHTCETLKGLLYELIEIVDYIGDYQTLAS